MSDSGRSGAPALDLVVLANLHLREPAAAAPPQENRPAHLAGEFAVRAVRDALRSGRPDAIALLGDLVADGSADYARTEIERLRDSLAAFGIPLLIAPGSHDLPLHEVGGVVHLPGPALCQAPFRYCRVRLEGRRLAEVRSVALADERFPGLFDAHVHTEFAYCAEDQTIEGALERMRALGLVRPAFVEHADQLYFPHEGFWKRTDCDDLAAIGRAAVEGGARHRAFRERMRPLRDGGVLVGLECEPEASGRGLAVLDEDRAGCDYLIGSVHHLEKGADEAVPQAEIVQRFMARTEQLARSGIDVLGHPFRYFRRYQRPVPTELFRPVAQLLAAEGVAAEINFHTNRPAPEFFAECLACGARVSVGSDAHSLVEVGELRPHLELLESIGALARLDEVLWHPYRTEPHV